MSVDLINRNVKTFMELLRVANRELFIYNGTRETIHRFETTTEKESERFLITSPEGFFNGSVINKHKPVFNGTTLELSLLRKYETKRQLVKGFSDITEKYALWVKDYRFGTSRKLKGIDQEAYQRDCREYNRLLRSVFKGLKIVEKQ